MASRFERHQPGIGELPASALAVAAGVITLILIYVGSRGLRDFDAALIGYAVGVVFAVIGLTYRYLMWISRPPTWRYFRAGWSNFFSLKRFRRYAVLVPKAWWTDIFAQTFIKERSNLRWVMHMCIFWGVVTSLMITIPLSLGWFHLTMAGDSPSHYTMWFFGVTLFNFPLNTALSFIVFHALDFTAALLLVGVLIAFWRRFTDAGLLATQRFGFDLMPLIMLFAIAVTGIALTFSSALWDGHFYWFISLTHEAIVVVWLLYLPFGKFFHIVERPATIGVTLYQQIAQDEDQEVNYSEGGRCRRCNREMPSSQFVGDLLATLDDLGQDYDLGDRGQLQEYCPSCKRILRGQAYYQLMGQRFL